MLRLATLVLAGAVIHSAALGAQSAVRRPTLVVSGGIAGQNDGGDNLGSPGLSASVGVEWAVTRSTLGLRVDAQGFDYSRQDSPDAFDRQGSAEQAGALTVVARWTPSGRLPLYLLGGGGRMLTTRIPGERHTRIYTTAGALGLGIPVMSRLSIEGQYLHSSRQLGRTRGLLAARVVLRI